MLEKLWAIPHFKHHLSTVLNSQKGNKFECIAKANAVIIVSAFPFQYRKKKSQTLISFVPSGADWKADQSHSFILCLPVHLGQHRAGPAKVQVQEKTPGGWAARWITGSRFVCSFRSLRNCAGLKQWLSYGAASHLPHLQPVMNDGSEGSRLWVHNP